jgi:4a-hydroxytetrahydrobiopterin dehydratase
MFRSDFAAVSLATAARIAQEEGVSRLSAKHCVACREGMPSLSSEESAALARELDGWTISDGPRLGKTWKFPDFATALAFVNRISAIADSEDHHPDVALSYGKVGVELWTHAAGGLTENDFIVAARIDDAHAAS